VTSTGTPEVRALARELSVPLDDAEPVLGRLRMIDALCARGFVVVVKWDGERDPANGDNGRYTVMLSGGDLGAEFFRRDDETLLLAVDFVFGEFSRYQRRSSEPD
jgi:hypothetical protein